MFEQEMPAIQLVISDYFNGIFNGNTEQLRDVFHPECLLFGEVNGQPYFKTLEQYLEVVGNRKSPAELNEPFNMKILAAELQGSIAHLRLYCPMLGFEYIDHLSLCRQQGRWWIVNKTFINI